MPAPDIDNAATVAIHGRDGNGLIAITTQGFVNASTPFDPDLTIALANIVKLTIFTQGEDGYLGCIGEQGRVDGVSVYPYNTPTPSIFLEGFSYFGTRAAGDPMPPQVAMLLVERTALAGRRGRVYLPHTRTGDIDGGGTVFWEEGQLGEVRDRYQNFVAAVADSFTTDPGPALSPAVISRATASATLVTDLIGRTRVATQRRRVTPP